MHWIETEKQKPPFNAGVIVYCRIYGRFIASYEQIADDVNDGVWVNWMNGERGILPPTHWMLLPEAPEGA